VNAAALIVTGARPDRAAELSEPPGAPDQLRRLLLERALAWARHVAPHAVYVCHPAGSPEPEVGAGVIVFSEADDLLTRGVDRVLARHPGAGLLIAGTSAPALAPTHAVDALEDLEHGCDVSVGPATDGGWYLLGLRRSHPELLRSSTLGEAFAAIAGEGLRIGMLRSERALSSAADARALLADPLAPAELRALL
jgi:hypothetical protein